jgi:UDP-N-acetylmuramyl pentapeptide phosphotransferase/UDP-N-acetylglucosamine-1-phosphate transferase
MVLASIVSDQSRIVLSSVSEYLLHADHPATSLFLLIAGAICAFVLSYLLNFGVIFVCHKFNIIRRPEPGRKPDTVTRLGGVGIYCAFVISALIFYIHNGDLQSKELTIFWLFLAAATLIVIVHAYDDVRPLKPLPKLLAQTLTVVIIMGPWINGHFNGVLLFGFSNPFQTISCGSLHWCQDTTVNIFIHDTTIRWLAIPAVLFTWFWMVGMMNAVNLNDGLDGLAGGIVAITAIFIMITSWLLQQYTIAVLAGIFAGAVLGFLPHNWNPARMYMGDSGSQFLGLGLAVLSIMGGAKVALAFMVLGVPILDVAVVMINRVRRGESPLHYDKTHLHYRLQATGLSVRQICYLFYGITIFFGILALLFDHIMKLIGIAIVVIVMGSLIYWVDTRHRSRGVTVKLDNGDPTPSQGGSTLSLPQGDQTIPETPVPTANTAGQNSTDTVAEVLAHSAGHGQDK